MMIGSGAFSIPVCVIATSNAQKKTLDDLLIEIINRKVRDWPTYSRPSEFIQPYSVMAKVFYKPSTNVGIANLEPVESLVNEELLGA